MFSLSLSIIVWNITESSKISIATPCKNCSVKQLIMKNTVKIALCLYWITSSIKIPLIFRPPAINFSTMPRLIFRPPRLIFRPPRLIFRPPRLIFWPPRLIFWLPRLTFWPLRQKSTTATNFPSVTPVAVNFLLVAPVAHTLPRSAKSGNTKLWSRRSKNIHFGSRQSGNTKIWSRPSDH